MNYITNAAPSLLTLGGPDPNGYVGSFTSHNLVRGVLDSKASWWTINYTGSSYDGVVLYTGADKEAYAIIDTGTSYMLMPELEYTPFAAALMKAGFACGTGSYCYWHYDTCE